jgi:hypothetical protein
VRDFAQVNEASVVTREVALGALELLEIDACGFDKMDRAILAAIIDKFDGGPVGVDTLAAAVGEESDTIGDATSPTSCRRGSSLARRVAASPRNVRRKIGPRALLGQKHGLLKAGRGLCISAGSRRCHRPCLVAARSRIVPDRRRQSSPLSRWQSSYFRTDAISGHFLERFKLSSHGHFACGSSQLDPRELVGGFDGLAVACSDGDRDTRIILERPRQRTANPRCAAVRIDRAAPSNRRARAQPNSSPVLSPLGSTVLDFVLALVAAMARQPDHRPVRDTLALAP